MFMRWVALTNGEQKAPTDHRPDLIGSAIEVHMRVAKGKFLQRRRLRIDYCIRQFGYVRRRKGKGGGR